MIITKGRYWNRTKYNTKTGLRRGETRYSTGTNKTIDWMGKEVKQPKCNMGKNGYE